MLITKGNVIIFERDEAVVGKSNAKEVRSQVTKGGMAGADGTNIDNPPLFPNGGRSSSQETLTFEGMAELCTKDD